MVEYLLILHSCFWTLAIQYTDILEYGYTSHLAGSISQVLYMHCGWLLPQVVNQKQTTNTLGVSAMKFYERQQFPSGFFSNSRLYDLKARPVFPVLHKSHVFLQMSQYWLPPVSHARSVKLLSWHVGQMQHHRTGRFSRWASGPCRWKTRRRGISQERCSPEDSQIETNNTAVCRSKEKHGSYANRSWQCKN